jgi:hypothetical protein
MFDLEQEIVKALIHVNPASVALNVMSNLRQEARNLAEEQKKFANLAVLAAFQLQHEGSNLTSEERSRLAEELELVAAHRDQLAAGVERLLARADSYSALADKAPTLSRRSGLRKQEMGS